MKRIFNVSCFGVKLPSSKGLGINGSKAQKAKALLFFVLLFFSMLSIPGFSAPASSNSSVSTTEDSWYVFNLSDFPNLSSNPLWSVFIKFFNGIGTLRINGNDYSNQDYLNEELLYADIAAGNLSYLPSTDGYGSPYDYFNFEIYDYSNSEYSNQEYVMDINVTAVNDAPVSSNTSVSLLEDSSYTFNASDFPYFDVENDSFVKLKIIGFSGNGRLLYGNSDYVNEEIYAANLSSGDLVYYPSSNGYGSPYDYFNFEVSDGISYSASYVMDINVTAVNDAPVIIGQNKTITVNEDSYVTIGFDVFNVSDVDNSYPQGFSITLENGSNYQLQNTTVIPASNYYGMIYVPAYVNDGAADSNKINLTIYVQPVNDLPNVSQNSPQQGYATANTTLTFNCTGSDVEKLDYLKLYIWNSSSGLLYYNTTTAVSGNASVSWQKAMAEGSFSWSCSAIDNNSAETMSSNYSLVVDSSGPVVSLVSPSDNYTETSSNNIVFSYNVSDSLSNLSACMLYLNGSLNQSSSLISSGSNSFNVSLEDNSYSWHIACNDSLGNLGNSSLRHLVVDTSDPSVSQHFPLSGSSLSTNSASFNCSATDDLGLSSISVYVYYSNGTLAYNSSRSVSSVSAYSVWNTTLSDNSYLWHCSATDSSGNSASGTNYSLVVDSSGPVVSLVSPSDNYTETGSNNIVFSYNVSDSLSNLSACMLYLNGSLNQSSSLISSGSNSFNVSLEDNSYSWHIACNDSLGNIGVSDSYSLNIELNAPVVSLNAPEANASYATTVIGFECSAADNNTIANISLYIFDENGSYYYIAQAQKGEESIAEQQWNVSFESDGSYSWKCEAYDVSGLKGESQLRSFSIDTSFPEQSEIRAESTTNSSAIISWLTDELSNSTVYYGLSESSMASIEESSVMTTTHSVMLLELLPDTTYYYRVGSCDSLGNCALSETGSFTTKWGVRPGNHAPIIQSFFPRRNLSLEPAATAGFSVNASDPDNDSIVIYWLVNGSLYGNGTHFSLSLSSSHERKDYFVQAVVSDGNLNTSQSWIVSKSTYPVTHEFSGNTTDFSDLPDLSNVSNIIIEKPQNGMIYFNSENLNLLGAVDIDSNIFISSSMVGINTTALPQFNKSATIIFYNISSVVVPKIYYNNGFTLKPSLVSEPCPESLCYNISYNFTTKTLRFNVAHFTTFRAVGSNTTSSSTESETKPKQYRLKVPRLWIDKEVARPGDTVYIGIDVENNGDFDLDGLKVTALIPELGLRRSVGPFDLDDGDAVQRDISLRIPETAAPGEYVVRITYSNGHVKRVKHRFIRVI